MLVLARSVPPGRVSTYGDLSPGAPRFAGTVLSSCADLGIPWHRVVRADGSLAKGERQRALLEAECVPFKGRRVDLEEAWWNRRAEWWEILRERCHRRTWKSLGAP